MHVKTRRLVLLSIMAAFSFVLMLLGTMIESNTLFFIAAASFLVGAVISMAGPKWGACFYVVCFLLALLFLPNKLYCFTYGAFGLYICIREIMRAHVANVWLRWVFKYIIFNVIYLPVLLFLPELFLVKELTTSVMLIFIAGGQIVLLVMDMAYEWFMRHVWTAVQRKL